uniref:Uncharacterized protein n=1 Tax=Anguilla anguilla TaxID=7936 RepID=A0A0E9U7E5_ANGAN
MVWELWPFYTKTLCYSATIWPTHVVLVPE